MLLAEEASEVGVDEVDVEPPNRDLLDVGKDETGLGVDPKELLVEPPNNGVVLLLPEVGKRGAGVEEDGVDVLPKVVELLIIEDAKTFEVLVGLDLGGEELSVEELKENIPGGEPNEVAPDGVEEKKL